VRLLFLTQVFDREDAVLGFVARWIEGLARECERVRVIALSVGDVGGLPSNVDAREVGRRGVIGRWLRYRRFLGEAFDEGFDAVLAHMVPRYALVAARPARRARARLFLWYTHGGVDARLCRAERAVEKIFTASPESLRLETEKRVVTGHGIDLAHFASHGRAPAAPPRLLSVGRLTPAKDPLTAIEALALLREGGLDVALDLVGGTLAQGDPAYRERVRQRLAGSALEPHVVLHGDVPYREVARCFHAATLVLNPSATGSLDKVVLEGMAAARPVLSCNEGFPALVAELGSEGRALCFARGDARDLAERCADWLGRSADERAALGQRLAAIVARDHEVDRLMARLVREMGAG
jgi:glycosyltransferase involved in cell wall biosynthesis